MSMMQIMCSVVWALAALVPEAALNASPTGASDESINIPVADLAFYQNPDGLTFANGRGDPATGPHSNYIKMARNSASPPHTHKASYYGVVITGIVSNERLAASRDRPLAPGSYWYQKGGEIHVTKCISPSDCLIFVTAQGPFDFQVAR